MNQELGRVCLVRQSSANAFLNSISDHEIGNQQGAVTIPSAHTVHAILGLQVDDSAGVPVKEIFMAAALQGQPFSSGSHLQHQQVGAAVVVRVHSLSDVVAGHATSDVDVAHPGGVQRFAQHAL